MPKYINYTSNLHVNPPFQLLRADLYCFWLPANCERLQAVLDERLNFPDRKVRYVPLLPSVLCIYADTPQAWSGDPEDRKEGNISMNETVFWILAVEQTLGDDGDWKSQRMVWFIPYIFVDNPLELIAGREVMGYPKAWAKVQMPRNRHFPDTFTIDPVSFARFTPETDFIYNRLMTVQRHPEDPDSEVSGDEWEMADAAKAVKSFIDERRKADGTCPETIDDLGDIWRLFKSSLGDLTDGAMPAVFLKQFPAADASGNAVYQALVESEFKVNGFFGGWALDKDEFTYKFEHLDSFPMAEDLGIPPEGKPLQAFWVTVSFANTAGKEIWRAES